jgi:hypothetical protein
MVAEFIDKHISGAATRVATEMFMAWRATGGGPSSTGAEYSGPDSEPDVDDMLSD